MNPKYLAPLILLILMATSIVIAVSPPRHVDPAELAPEKPFPAQLLLLYRSVIEAAVAENYTKAAGTLEEAFRVYAPENLRYIIERFSELLRQEISDLNESRIEMELAERFIELGYIEESRERIDNALSMLARAILTKGELDVSVKELIQTIGPQLSQLPRDLESLEELIRRYSLRLSELERMVLELKRRGVRNTTLTLIVTPMEAWVGSKVMVQGVLRTENGEAMAGRMVEIHVGDVYSTVLETDAEGIFKGYVMIPYIYAPSIMIQASYVPKGPDAGRFRASESRKVAVSLLYVTPVIEARLSEAEALPLSEVKVEGYVSTWDMGQPRSIMLEAFGAREKLPLVDGRFRHVVTVPPEASEGTHYIRLWTESIGVLAPSSTVIALQVYRLKAKLELDLPSHVLAGSSLKVVGRLSTDLGEPISGSKIVVEGLGESLTVYTDESGYFTADLRIPLTVGTSSQGVSVTAYPADPRYGITRESRSIIVINLVPIMIPLSAFLLLSWSLLSRLRPWGEYRRKTTPPTVGLETPPKPTAITDIPSAYMYSVNVIERSTGVRMRPSHTIREFYSKAAPLLGEVPRKLFREISSMAEEHIYGGIKVELERMLELVRRLELIEG